MAEPYQTEVNEATHDFAYFWITKKFCNTVTVLLLYIDTTFIFYNHVLDD